MKAIQTINNNVAVCVDSAGNELIAFGKGIGYPEMPYEIESLDKLDMTFYRVDPHIYTLLKEIPEDVFMISAKIVAKAQQSLSKGLNPNVVFSLADHINFAIIRQKKYKELKMAFSYDVEQMYPQESNLGKYALKLIQETLYITLPESEITNIALHFVNAEENLYEDPEEVQTEDIINKVVDVIEKDFDLEINRKEFNFNRFAMHLRYYLKRIKTGEQFMDNCEEIMESMKSELPEIYSSAKRIALYIDEYLNATSTEDEIFYLMIHINRMINKQR